jgi:hypothetical protein
MAAGQVSAHTGVATFLDSLPNADLLLANRARNLHWSRDVLKEKGITACIFGRKSHKICQRRQALIQKQQQDRVRDRPPQIFKACGKREDRQYAVLPYAVKFNIEILFGLRTYPWH